jgi:hypothetical protein
MRKDVAVQAHVVKFAPYLIRRAVRIVLFVIRASILVNLIK